MKTIGLLGGMSWESTLDYYRRINEAVAHARGGLHSAALLLSSVDFAPVEALQRAEDWDGVGRLLAAEARRLSDAGADFLVLCSNTAHRAAEAVEAAAPIPLLHIADCCAEALRAAGHARAGLLGTRYTMAQPFLRDRLRRGGVETLVPEGADAEALNALIFGELCRGRAREESRRLCLRIADTLRARGAQALLLGCTELGMLLRPGDGPLPVFDSAAIHADAAARHALGEP